MRRLRARGEPVHILDIAAGHGRYVLDALRDGDERPESILLRDYSERNVRDGEALIEAGEARRRSRASTTRDAFDRASLAALRRGRRSASSRGSTSSSPTTTPVRRRSRGLADAIAPGGFLVYTGQPWHPQLELIARALTSHRGGAAWVMRRRTQAEMDQLVARRASARSSSASTNGASSRCRSPSA